MHRSHQTWLCISKMAAVRHLGFVILQFLTTHEVPLKCSVFPANGVTIRFDVTEALRFTFLVIWQKCLSAPILGQFWGNNRGESCPILTPNELVLTFRVFTSVPLLVKNDQEMRP